MATRWPTYRYGTFIVEVRRIKQETATLALFNCTIRDKKTKTSATVFVKAESNAQASRLAIIEYKK